MKEPEVDTSIKKRAPVHKHILKEMHLSDVRAVHPGRYQAWSCDGKNITGCKSGQLLESEEESKKNPDETVGYCETCDITFCT